MPEDAGTGGDLVYFSGKKAEEVGFEKFAKRQAQLQGIHVLVLDHMRITREKLEEESEAIADVCANITDLDLGSNLFESLDEILEVARLLPKLRNLALDGNRMAVGSTCGVNLGNIKSLSLSDTLFSWPEICTAASHFPNLTSLMVASSELQTISNEPLPATLETLDLSGNHFTNLSSLFPLHSCGQLHTLSLKKNLISSTDSLPTKALSSSLQSLDISHNAIQTWSIINSLPHSYPSLQHLRTASNPLYATLTTPAGKPLTPEDGYMLTIARLPDLKTLNYSSITTKERLNAETYYLNQIAAEISLVTTGTGGVAAVKAAHPRWNELVEEYGEPVISSSTISTGSTNGAIDPNSLAARLATLTFYLADPGMFPHVPTAEREWKEELPKSFDIYFVLGRVGKKLGILPLDLRLIWETGEWDPAQRSTGQTEIEEWDSDDEEVDNLDAHGELVKREVELVAGTRALGTYVEGREARVRIEVKKEEVEK
jgi:hypothetical protein